MKPQDVEAAAKLLQELKDMEAARARFVSLCGVTMFFSGHCAEDANRYMHGLTDAIRTAAINYADERIQMIRADLQDLGVQFDESE